jgi:NAD(P)-dependent dehydrogenase (short-subunit alcohol dehydrogenase family)
MPFNSPIKDWHGKTVWLLGASSGIGRATASALHAKGARVIVSARNASALNEFVAQHLGAIAMPLDASDPAAVRAACAAIVGSGGLDHAMYCAGHYHDMSALAFDLDDMVKHNQINYVGALYMLDAVLPHFLGRAAQPARAAKSALPGISASAFAPPGPGAACAGHITLVGSVAGYRGLPKSLAYGPTKAALINLAETLYLDLHDKGIGVSLVNPGFVKTPLTAQNDFKMPALISPEEAATAILEGWANGEFEIHFPKRFTRWMKAMQALPYGLFFGAIRRFVTV